MEVLIYNHTQSSAAPNCLLFSQPNQTRQQSVQQETKGTGQLGPFLPTSVICWMSHWPSLSQFVHLYNVNSKDTFQAKSAALNSRDQRPEMFPFQTKAILCLILKLPAQPALGADHSCSNHEVNVLTLMHQINIFH